MRGSEDKFVGRPTANQRQRMLNSMGKEPDGWCCTNDSYNEWMQVDLKEKRRFIVTHCESRFLTPTLLQAPSV